MEGNRIVSGDGAFGSKMEDGGIWRYATTGVFASPFSEEAFEAVKNRNMTDELSNIPPFYFRGGWDMEQWNIYFGQQNVVIIR